MYMYRIFPISRPGCAAISKRGAANISKITFSNHLV